ncbi:MAG: hypothetical protein L0Z07_03350 [Planctomycetes bacterium]|nr:hypothetical protein [Planctomycetota bacterium]
MSVRHPRSGSNGCCSRPLEMQSAHFLGAMAGAIVLALVVADHSANQRATADEAAPITITPGSAAKPISFRDRLVVGLQARLESEIIFVDLVVHLVQIGKVPQRLVDETFFWSRERAAARPNVRPRRPIIYFQPAMNARLRRLGALTTT